MRILSSQNSRQSRSSLKSKRTNVFGGARGAGGKNMEKQMVLLRKEMDKKIKSMIQEAQLKLSQDQNKEVKGLIDETYGEMKSQFGE